LIRDSELDRLGAARRAAFERLCGARRVLNETLAERSIAGEHLRQAYIDQREVSQRKKQAYTHAASLKHSHQPHIDEIEAVRPQYRKKINDAMFRARQAHNHRDVTTRTQLTMVAERTKRELRSHTERRWQLVSEIHNALSVCQEIDERYATALQNFEEKQQRYLNARAAHITATATHEAAALAHDAAEKEFRVRLEMIQARRQRHTAVYQAIAVAMDIPLPYFGRIRIVYKEADCTVHAYFGGVRKPDGEGHGHYVMDINGICTYRREPRMSKGTHNFLSYPHYDTRHAPEAVQKAIASLIAVHRERQALRASLVS